MRNIKTILTNFGMLAAAGLVATVGAPAAWACYVDKDCSQTCGGQTCYWSGGPYGDYCVAASDPAHSWCSSDLDCNCSGATCSGNHCSIVLPASGTTGGAGTTTGGAGTTGGIGTSTGGSGSTTGGGGSTTGSASTSGGGTTGGTVSVGSTCNVDKDCSATCGGLTCDWNAGHTCQVASTPANSWCDTAADCNCAGATCTSFHCSAVSAAGGTSGGGTTTGAAYASSGGCSTSGGSNGLVLGLGLLAGLAFTRRRL